MHGIETLKFALNSTVYRPINFCFMHLFIIIIELIDATAYSFARFGQGSGPIYLDQVACTGSEATLGNCSANPIGVHDCSHVEDAGVGCQG